MLNVSQLVRYARACSNYEDFVDRGNYSPQNCCLGDIAVPSLRQLLKSSMGDTMTLLIPTAWLRLNL